jgi:DNA-binding transcriptional regulator YiaG
LNVAHEINESKETRMGKIESTIKAEIQRLAKHEVKVVFRPLRKEVWEIRLKLSNLLKAFTPMNRLAKEISESKAKEPKLAASPEEVKASRFTPERIRGLRKKLGISQRELGVLVGATIGAVLSWEKGKFKPQGEKKAALVALRKVRNRDVKKMLAENEGEKNKDRKAHPHRGRDARVARAQGVTAQSGECIIKIPPPERYRRYLSPLATG